MIIKYMFELYRLAEFAVLKLMFLIALSYGLTLNIFFAKFSAGHTRCYLFIYYFYDKSICLHYFEYFFSQIIHYIKLVVIVIQLSLQKKKKRF